MLGEKVGEETGKVSVRRVLPNDGFPKLEVTFQSNGKLLGVEHRNMCTYTATLAGDGITHGEGQGIATGRNGEIAKWKGHGAGRLKGDGSASYRGMVQYETQSEVWKRLNGIALAFEYEVDAEGNTKTAYWEWK
jgi:hypothetical protein